MNCNNYASLQVPNRKDLPEDHPSLIVITIQHFYVNKISIFMLLLSHKAEGKNMEARSVSIYGKQST